MKEYMVGVFVITAAVGLCRLLSYKGRDERVEKFAFGVLIIYTVLLPLGDMVGELGTGSPDFSLPDSGEYSPDYAIVAEEAFCDGVRRAVCDKFSFDPEDVVVIAEGFDFSSMKAEKIRIVLCGRAALGDYGAVERYINGLDIGECDAEIEIG